MHPLQPLFPGVRNVDPVSWMHKGVGSNSDVIYSSPTFTCMYFGLQPDTLSCRWCASEGYCNLKCRQMAWKKYHWVECPVANLWKKVCNSLFCMDTT